MKMVFARIPANLVLTYSPEILFDIQSMNIYLVAGSVCPCRRHIPNYSRPVFRTFLVLPRTQLPWLLFHCCNRNCLKNIVFGTIQSFSCSFYNSIIFMFVLQLSVPLPHAIVSTVYFLRRLSAVTAPFYEFDSATMAPCFEGVYAQLLPYTAALLILIEPPKMSFAAVICTINGANCVARLASPFHTSTVYSNRYGSMITICTFGFDALNYQR